jgi:hypothetical protein
VEGENGSDARLRKGAWASNSSPFNVSSSTQATSKSQHTIGVYGLGNHGEDIQRDEGGVGDGSYRRLCRRCEQRLSRNACTVHILQSSVEALTNHGY